MKKSLIMYAVVIAAVVMAVVIVMKKPNTQTSTTSTTSESTITLMGMVTEYEIQGTQHVAIGEEHDAYNSNPPNSGWHYAQAPAWGAYKKPLVDESALHAVEHGGIWISYTDEVSDDDLLEIRKIQRQNAGAVISSPRPENDSPIAVVAWGKVLKLDTVNTELITKFIEENKNNTHEPLAR